MVEIREAIERAAIRIKDVIYRKDFDYATSSNSTGDEQLKVDVETDDIIQEEFMKASSVHTISSEEKDFALILNPEGKYFIGYDPLDGSSVIDVNLSVGSIFGIFEESFTGSNLVAACYVVYGPRVELVFAEHNEAKFYLLNADTFHYVKDVKMNQKGKLVAPGGTQKFWEPHHKELIESFFQDGYRLRYSGGMVPDLHHILIKGGGIFSYPATEDRPDGKLRMLFEVFPFAYIFEASGGIATNGTRRLLELHPEHIHDTSQCFFGSTYEMTRVSKVYGEHQ